MEHRMELELNAEQRKRFTVTIPLTEGQKASLHKQHGVRVDHIDVPVRVDDRTPIKVEHVQIECW